MKKQLLSKKQKILVHVIARRLKIEGEAYREMISAATDGRTESSKEMTQSEFNKLVTWAIARGYRFRADYKKYDEYADRPDMASPAQMRLIELLFRNITDYPDDWEYALSKYISKRICGKDLLVSLDWKEASNVIEGLKKMNERRNKDEKAKIIKRQ